jgi:FHA domain containing protein
MVNSMEAAMLQIKVIANKTNVVQTKDVADGDWAMLLGRHSECDIVLSGSDVSRKHARLLSCNGQIFIEDLGSTAGTFLNNEKIPETTSVKMGDIIKIANYEIVLSGNSHLPESVPVFQQPAAESKREVPVDFKKEFQNASVLYEPEIMALTRSIHEDILEKLNLSESALKELNNSTMRSKLEASLDRTLKERRHEIPVKIPMDLFRQALLDELIGFGPLSPLLRSPRISEIMINGPHVVFVESAGKLFDSGVRFFNEQHLISIIQRIVEPLGRHIDDASPMVDARLPDGSRVNAVIPPLALHGAALTVRKFADRKLTTDDLIAFGSMTREMALFLQEAVRSRKNILVSGGTGSGKTTLLNVLSLFIPEDERVITVEDSAELKLTHPNLVNLEARPANIEGKGRISIRDLVINTLRMRPDRIIVGECRGAEALDMLQAMNTGHDGSLTTAHANNPRDALARLENMVMMAGFELPSTAIREQIASALDIIVQQTRLVDGSRKVVKITEVTGREGNQILLQDIFTFEQTGLDSNGKVQGYHTATGNIPIFIDELRKSGRLNLDMSVFVPKV